MENHYRRIKFSIKEVDSSASGRLDETL